MLELRNVCKTFHAGTPDEKKALADVSLKIGSGDFVSIIGANGAGKSTLFNAVCGSFPLDSGSVILDGRNVTMMPEHHRAKLIGRLFQDPMRGSAPDMSIEENLALASLLIGGVFFGKHRGISLRAVGAVLGAFLFRLVYALALRLDMPAFMLKLVSSVIVVIAISGPYLRKQLPLMVRRWKANREGRGADA